MGEALDDFAAEALFVIEHVMGDIKARGNLPGIVNILPGATGTLTVRRRAMIIKLKRHTDNVVALLLEQSGNDGRIDAARHGNDDTRLSRGLWQAETVERRQG